MRSSVDSFRTWSKGRIKRDSTNVIKPIQRRRTWYLDIFFKLAAKGGDEIAYTLGLPLLYWHLYDQTTVVLVIISWALVFYVGHVLKDLLQLPRPHLVDKEIAVLEQHFSIEYGLPSTHAQAAFCIPVVLLFCMNPDNFALYFTISLVFASAVTFSRIYLGVHSLLDVTVGAALGVVTAIFVVQYGIHIRNFFLTPLVGPLAAILIPVGLLATYPSTPHFSTTFRDTASILGVFSGCIMGDYSRERGYLGHSAQVVFADFKWALVKSVAGLLVVVILHEVAKRFVWRIISKLNNTTMSSSQCEDYALLIPYKYCAYIFIGYNSVVTVPLLFRAAGVPIW